ncbi:MAG: sugar ABC transporter permease, partial [Caldilineaceae bacterium]|nr:sugar ABC transporter permease [Caldilineaceae bacterium]
MSTPASTMGGLQGSAVRRPGWRKRWLNRETGAAWLFILPSLIGFVLFYAVPAIRGLWISTTDWDLLTDPTFIGAENYAKLVSDPNFWNALKVTLYYVVLNIPLQTVIAIGIAVMMDRLTKSIFVRSIIILPWLMPNVVVALLWLWLLDPTLGIVNVGLQALGLDSIPFLTSTQFAMPSIAGINIWRHMGYTALLIFAGLQAIPGSVYEAAAIDGAS